MSFLKSNSTQQKISNYLFQARIAINRDFVPLFLGANETREHYFRHNTKLSCELHDINREKLVIIADGTYCRIEKSANNAFNTNHTAYKKRIIYSNHFYFVVLMVILLIAIVLQKRNGTMQGYLIIYWKKMMI